MRKKIGRKIALHKETLHSLDALQQVAGGSSPCTAPRACSNPCTLTVCNGSACGCTTGGGSAGAPSVCCGYSAPFVCH
jgi:hypothetical protein